MSAHHVTLKENNKKIDEKQGVICLVFLLSFIFIFAKNHIKTPQKQPFLLVFLRKMKKLFFKKSYKK